MELDPLIGIHPDAVDTSDPSFPAAHLLLGGLDRLYGLARHGSARQLERKRDRWWLGRR